MILRDRDNSGGGWTSASDGTLEERRFYCQNWRADMVAVTDEAGQPIEFVRYSPYGVPTVYPLADINRDGQVSSADSTDWNNAVPTSNAAVSADLNFDGTIDTSPSGADRAAFNTSYSANLGKSGKGVLSSSGVTNRKGYAGYEWDPVLNAFHVRHRVSRPDMGRWMSRDRDPWLSLGHGYRYCLSKPTSAIGPKGWDPNAPSVPDPRGSAPANPFWSICWNEAWRIANEPYNPNYCLPEFNPGDELPDPEIIDIPPAFTIPVLPIPAGPGPAMLPELAPSLVP